eukprot:1139436-Pelagomonas_calceolata.AAC.1
MQDFLGGLRYRQQKVWREADALSPREMNRKAVYKQRRKYKDLFIDLFEPLHAFAQHPVSDDNVSPAANQPESWVEGQPPCNPL